LTEKNLQKIQTRISAEHSPARIKVRVMKGGHDVDPEKAIQRGQILLSLLAFLRFETHR